MLRKQRIAAGLVTLALAAGMLAPVPAQTTEARREYNLGIKAYNRGNAAEALKRFGNAAQMDATYADAFYNLGSIHYQQQDYQAARNAFKQALSLRPTDTQARYNLGLTHEKLQEYSEAIQILSQVTPQDPNYAKAQVRLGELRKRVPASVAKQPTTSPGDISNLSKYGTSAPGATVPSQIFSKGHDGPTGITIGPGGFLYVANYSQNLIYKVGADGEKTVFVKGGGLKGPIGLTFNPKTNELYAANYLDNNIARITPDGKVSILARDISKPYYLFLDTYNNILFVSEQGSNAISKVAL